MFARSTALSRRSLHAALAAAGFFGLILLVLLAAGSRPVSQAAEPPGTVGPPAAKPGAGDEAPPIFVDKIPDGYRDWKLISVAHEEGDLNDLRAILGNDVAINASREERLPFPDGAIIARLAWNYAPLQESFQAFGQLQSYVAGPPKNGVQFMVKDSSKYASTGGWGYAQFNDGQPAAAAVQNSCLPCHQIVKAHDFVFNHYSP